MSARGKGLKPSNPARTHHRLGAAMHPAIGAALKAGPVGQGVPKAFRGPITDQRQSSTCHAHSRAQLLFTAYAAAGMALPFFPSMACIATCTYADDRALATPFGLSLPPLRDVGAELQSSSDATNRWGLAPIGWPGATPTGPFTDWPDGTAITGADGQLPILAEPNVAELHVAAARLTVPEYQLAGSGSSLVSLVIASLDSNIGLQTGGPVGPAYEGLSATSVAMPEPNGDGHAQAIDFYRPMTDAEKAQSGSTGTYVFEVAGSWGLGFANRGVALVSEEWVEAQWNLFPGIVKAAS
jgi:hypothetical protein